MQHFASPSYLLHGPARGNDWNMRAHSGRWRDLIGMICSWVGAAGSQDRGTQRCLSQIESSRQKMARVSSDSIMRASGNSLIALLNLFHHTMANHPLFDIPQLRYFQFRLALRTISPSFLRTGSTPRIASDLIASKAGFAPRGAGLSLRQRNK
jgi:hypothetical protein